MTCIDAMYICAKIILMSLEKMTKVKRITDTVSGQIILLLTPLAEVDNIWRSINKQMISYAFLV